MNGGSLQKVALALAESRTLDSVLQTIVRSLAEHCSTGCGSRSAGFDADFQIWAQYKLSYVYYACEVIHGK
jgi:imidazolonepropionase-like amidohydrolase